MRSLIETSPLWLVMSALPSRPMMLMSPWRVDRTTDAFRGTAMSRSLLMRRSLAPCVLASTVTICPLTLIWGRVALFHSSA